MFGSRLVHLCLFRIKISFHFKIFFSPQTFFYFTSEALRNFRAKFNILLHQLFYYPMERVDWLKPSIALRVFLICVLSSIHRLNWKHAFRQIYFFIAAFFYYSHLRSLYWILDFVLLLLVMEIIINQLILW